MNTDNNVKKLRKKNYFPNFADFAYWIYNKEERRETKNGKTIFQVWRNGKLQNSKRADGCLQL